MNHYQKLVQECDQEIRSGMAQNAALRLAGINTSRVPREWRLPLAQICRRAGRWDLGLTLLSRFVHGKSGRAKLEPTDNELAEYGILLCRIGATNEAQNVLAQVDTAKAPEAFQYRAIVELTNWNFPEAIINFNHYLQTSPGGYQRLVAQVNLAAAHVEIRDHETARRMLEETVRLARDENAKRLLTTSLAYRAQLHIQERAYSEAKADIRAGELSVESAQTSDRHVFLKWKLILESLEKNSVAPLSDLRVLARKNYDWEDLRLADLYSCKISFEMERFLYLMFGTPFPGFRQRIYQEIGELPDRDVFYLGAKKCPRFDIRTGEIDGLAAISPGRKCHQLLEVLLRDFYKPKRIPGIFTELFPGDHFDPISSPDRCHAILNRTRNWIAEREIPIEIREDNGFYSLIISGHFSFLIPFERKQVDGMNLHFQRLAAEFSNLPSFSSNDAREKLGLSRRTIQRLLNWGLENGRLSRQGTNKQTSYELLAPLAGPGLVKPAA